MPTEIAIAGGDEFFVVDPGEETEIAGQFKPDTAIEEEKGVWKHGRISMQGRGDVSVSAVWIFTSANHRHFFKSCPQIQPEMMIYFFPDPKAPQLASTAIRRIATRVGGIPKIHLWN